ncbi:MAG: hypothetical protein KKC18_13015 [Chloroflexi bacterium]|nr:hypothetical protein [Chloroflexota bacterium]
MSSEPNAYCGIAIVYQAHDNTIGGDEVGEGNYISGNGTQPEAGDGVVITDANTRRNELSGNVIGLAADNVTPMGNAANCRDCSMSIR